MTIDPECELITQFHWLNESGKEKSETISKAIYWYAITDELTFVDLSVSVREWVTEWVANWLKSTLVTKSGSVKGQSSASMSQGLVWLETKRVKVRETAGDSKSNQLMSY